CFFGSPCFGGAACFLGSLRFCGAACFLGSLRFRGAACFLGSLRCFFGSPCFCGAACFLGSLRIGDAARLAIQSGWAARNEGGNKSAPVVYNEIKHERPHCFGRREILVANSRSFQPSAW